MTQHAHLSAHQAEARLRLALDTVPSGVCMVRQTDLAAVLTLLAAVRDCANERGEAIARMGVETAEPVARCKWCEDADGNWHVSCSGRLWVFGVGGPTENRLGYCFDCRRKIEEHPYAAPTGWDDVDTAGMTPAGEDAR